MQTIAIMKAAPVSDQKARLVADQVRGLPVAKALNLLTFSPKKSAVLITKVLESAIANAEHNDGADIDVRAHRVRCHAGAEQEKRGQDHKPAGKE